MADIKISALSAAGALGGGELLAGVQAGGNVAVTPAQILAYVLGAPATGEAVEDIAAGLFAAGAGIALSYDDAGNSLTIASSVPKVNVTSSGPGVSNDGTQGYSPGSRWLNTTSGVTWSCIDASAGAAVWSAGGSLWQPGYVSGFYYMPPVVTAPNTSVTIASDTLCAVPIEIGQKCTLASIAFRIATGAAGNARVGLYANASGPANKIVEGTAAPSTGTAGVIDVALAANTTLAPGIYWLASLFSAAPAVFGVATSERGLLPLIGSSSASNLLAASLGVAGVCATGATPYGSGLPADFGTWAEATTTPRVPFLIFKTV